MNPMQGPMQNPVTTRPPAGVTVECTYSKQLNKKRKKWLDGHVSIRSNQVVLYDDTKTRIYSTVSYKIEEDEILLPHFVIRVDSVEPLMNASAEPLKQKRDCRARRPLRSIRAADAASEDASDRIFAGESVARECVPSVPEEEEQACTEEPAAAPQARTLEDVLGLFKEE